MTTYAIWTLFFIALAAATFFHFMPERPPRLLVALANLIHALIRRFRRARRPLSVWRAITRYRPSKIWLVQGGHPATRPQKDWYPTDPRGYGLPGLRAVSDEVYAAMANRVKAFQVKDDAIDFVYQCGLESTHVHGFRLVDGAYRQDRVVTNEVLNTNW